MLKAEKQKAVEEYSQSTFSAPRKTIRFGGFSSRLAYEQHYLR